MTKQKQREFLMQRYFNLLDVWWIYKQKSSTTILTDCEFKTKDEFWYRAMEIENVLSTFYGEADYYKQWVDYSSQGYGIH